MVPAAPAGLDELAQAALQGSPEAIAGLRAAGPAGMEAMLAMVCPGGTCAGPSAEGSSLDRVCGVRDCADLQLFWYTDLEVAKAAARASGKPILSLRLMGKLDEEMSCANSRFFRTVFYKNSEINKMLRERFILHWRSVRPVPRVTIDFGDGTRLERTLTGNSIHYVLDSHGRLVEALPGLYGPQAFRVALEKAERAARQASNLADASLAAWLSLRFDRELEERGEAAERDYEAAKPRPKPRPVPAAAAPATDGPRDPWKILQESGALTVGEPPTLSTLDTGAKRTAEWTVLDALFGVSDDDLRLLGQARAASIDLDPSSRVFLLRKHGVTDPAEAERLVKSFEKSVALDEVINEYRTGPAILKRLKEPETWKDFDLEAFNLWVYEEVFRTPLSDPWLGLAPEDVFTALPPSTRTAGAATPEARSTAPGASAPRPPGR
jgi:hypothetical protein